jgi:anti-sigma factor RsiW
MRTNRPEPHTLAGAYALDALTQADRARFERHLARCEQCAREVSGLAEATAALAAAAAAEPAAGLTQRALAAAARTRQRRGR